MTINPLEYLYGASYTQAQQSTAAASGAGSSSFASMLEAAKGEEEASAASPAAAGYEADTPVNASAAAGSGALMQADTMGSLLSSMMMGGMGDGSSMLSLILMLLFSEMGGSLFGAGDSGQQENGVALPTMEDMLSRLDETAEEGATEEDRYYADLIAKALRKNGMPILEQYAEGKSAREVLQNAINTFVPLDTNKDYGAVTNAAITRLGDPYSRGKAGKGDYTDCSYLSRWCYRTIGIEIPRTAAAQAKYCVENDMTIDKSELQPGDLIFFSLHENGRYMDITHVGIYAGDNMMVDASSARGEVVYRQLFGGQVLYGRPRSKESAPETVAI